MLAVLLWAYVAKKHQDNTGQKLQATEWWEMLTHFSHAWPCRALQHVLYKFLTALLRLLEVFRTAYQCYKQQCLIFITSLQEATTQKSRKTRFNIGGYLHRDPTCSFLVSHGLLGCNMLGEQSENRAELTWKGRCSRWSDIGHLLLV